jgi:hypothetical protein
LKAPKNSVNSSFEINPSALPLATASGVNFTKGVPKILQIKVVIPSINRHALNYLRGKVLLESFFYTALCPLVKEEQSSQKYS